VIKMNSDHDFKNNNYEKLKCIWMASQVIEYKLCDNNFDCENCIFDKVIRNLEDKKAKRTQVSSNAVNSISEKLKSIQYESNIIRLRNNLIAKEICRDTYYMGIDPILNGFLDSGTSINLLENRKGISRGEELIRISGEWGSVSVASPVNLMIYDKVGGASEDPLKPQWFAIIGASREEISESQLSGDDWNKIHEKAVDIIEKINAQVPLIGATMMDGGNQIHQLHKLIGSKKYISILKSLAE
jgi:hypothetical protein